MIFDKLCGLVERHFPTMRKPMLEAQVFEFTDDPRDVLPDQYTPEEVEEYFGQFILPFHCTAIEDKVSCIVLQDMEDQQVGLSGKRSFLMCEPVNEQVVNFTREARDENPAQYVKAIEAVRRVKEKFGDVWTIVLGTFTLDTDTKKAVMNGEVHGSFFAQKDRVSLLPPKTARLHDSATIQNVKTAVEELAMMNNADRFVVERKAPPPRKRSKKSRALIPRTHDRPLYTLLTPKQIWDKFGFTGEQSPTGTANDRRVWRRRHWRRYSHERYTEERRAKPQLIDATWVGPTEAKINKRHYKIRLDL